MDEDGGVVRSRVWRDGKVVDEDFDFERISDHLEDRDSLTWVDICDPDHRILASIHRGFAEVKLQGVQRWRVV
jgi:hypothetical protein